LPFFPPLFGRGRKGGERPGMGKEEDGREGRVKGMGGEGGEGTYPSASL